MLIFLLLVLLSVVFAQNSINVDSKEPVEQDLREPYDWVYVVLLVVAFFGIGYYVLRRQNL